MKKNLLLMVISAFLLFLGTSQVYAYTLIIDSDTTYQNYFDFDDTNPDEFNPDDTATEKLWLEALLGFNVNFYYVNNGDASKVEDPTSFINNWTYAVLKYGDGKDNFDHVAIQSTLNNLGQETSTFPLTEESFGYGKNGISHITYFNRVPSVPEPTTMLLLGAGLIGLAVFGRRRFVK